MLTLLSALQYSLYKTKTYLSFRLDISHFLGGKTFHAILGTILSIPIDISCEIFIRFVKAWALMCSQFYYKAAYQKLRA